MSDDEDEDSNEKKLVGVRISEERRQRWKEQVEESNEYNSMAQAMRVGFEQLFDDSSGAGGMETERVIERIDKLEQEVTDNREQIERIPYNYPKLEEISEEVVYRLAEVGEEKQQERRY